MADLGPVAWAPAPNARSMRLAAKLGFTEVERLQAYGAEQWFGMCSPVKPSPTAKPPASASTATPASLSTGSTTPPMSAADPHLPAVYAVPRWRGCVRKDQHFSVGGDP